MCTALSITTGDHYFGRTLDYETSFGERVTVTPRNYPFPFRHTETAEHHYAMIGMTAGEKISCGFPLYYDGVNEKGLGIAGLNFVGNAVYRDAAPTKTNLCHFEFIPWILGTCASVREVLDAVDELNITNTPLSDTVPPAQLHWLIADREGAVAVESVADGLMVYDDPVGVLTNNPPFPMQMQGLNDLINLSPREPENRFSAKYPLSAYSRGMGAIGLPGDVSSGSRFRKAAFLKLNSLSGEGEADCVGQFFHILGGVEMVRGSCILENGEPDITLYTSCCNASRGIYYYTTYGNRQITAVDMHNVDLDGTEPVHYPLLTEQSIFKQN